MLDGADEMRAYLCGARALIPFPGLGCSVPTLVIFTWGTDTAKHKLRGHQVSEEVEFFNFFILYWGIAD